jgi:L-2-hydroxyglutarate oxidase LhgO
VSEDVFITIIGAGVIGCAVAFELSQSIKKDIVVIEKNPRINGENQSSRNSGVVHSGIYYPRDFGPLKSRLCIEGNQLIYRFCKENNIPCIKTGKLVVATSALEEEYLEDVLRIGRDNGVRGLRVIEKKAIKRLEPNVEGTKAVLVPSSGIIEPTGFVNSLYRFADSGGVIFLSGNEVVDIAGEDKGFSLKIESSSGTEEFKTKILINSGGLFSDRIARMVNPDCTYELDPVKGESAKFYSSRREEIFVNGMNIYPVPFGYLPDGGKMIVPFKEFHLLFRKHKVNKSVGVHITPTFDTSDGKYEIGDMMTLGPAYSKPKSREDYINSRDLDYFLSMVLPFFPNLKVDDITHHQVGIRAKLKNQYDFIISRDSRFPDCINLVGIDSPGLTSSLAIAKHVKKILEKI